MALSNEEMGVAHPDLNALAAFVDGRLTDADRTAVAAHLGGCVECRTIFATQARGRMPPAVHAGERAGLRSRTRFRPAVWLPIAATVALATTTAVLVWRIDRSSPPPSSEIPVAPEPARPKPETPVPAAPGGEIPIQPPKNPAPVVTPPPTKGDPLSTRRGAVRVVNGKTFRLVAGEWIDSAYDPVALLPVQDIVGPDARMSLLNRTPALAPYAALGPKVTVAHDGVVYRFRQ